MSLNLQLQAANKSRISAKKSHARVAIVKRTAGNVT